MFTGLIKEIGTLRSVTPTGGVVRLRIEAPVTAGRTRPGDSVAINGICLTVTESRERAFTVEAVAETQRLTTLGEWRPGRSLHLEPALRVGDPIDGHLVQGHVDGVGEVKRLDRSGGGLVMTVAAAAPQRAFLTPKGSVAIDGVSLTVDEGPFDYGFTVNLIPHTLGATHFGRLRTGQSVNLEMDVLVKAVRSGDWTMLPAMKAGAGGEDVGDTSSGRTMHQLLARGFDRSRFRK